VNVAGTVMCFTENIFLIAIIWTRFPPKWIWRNTSGNLQISCQVTGCSLFHGQQPRSTHAEKNQSRMRSQTPEEISLGRDIV
jgi:hypothetical protein